MERLPYVSHSNLPFSRSKSPFPVIAIVELAERFSFYGSSVVFVCTSVSRSLDSLLISLPMADKFHPMASPTGLTHGCRVQGWPIRCFGSRPTGFNRSHDFLSILVNPGVSFLHQERSLTQDISAGATLHRCMVPMSPILTSVVTTQSALRL